MNSFFWKSSEFEFNQANGLLAGWYEIVAMIEFSIDENFFRFSICEVEFQTHKIDSKWSKRSGQKAATISILMAITSCNLYLQLFPN